MLRFFVVGFFSPNLSAQKKRRKVLESTKKNMDPSRSPKSQRKALNWNTPRKLRNGDPQWWALEMVDSFKNVAIFGIYVKNFWGVHCTLPKTKSYFCSPLRRKSLPIHPKNGSRRKVSQQRPSGAFDVSFTEWKPQKMERESSYTRPRNKPTKKIPQLPPSPRKKGRQLQAFRGKKKKVKEKQTRGLVKKSPRTSGSQ